MAQVQYLDYQVQEFPLDRALYPLFHKRIAFAHEGEVRILQWCSEHLPGKRVRDHTPTDEEKRVDEYELKRGEELKVERGTGISLEFDVEALVRNIAVHPYAPEWYFRVIKLIVEKFTPILVEKVKWSSIKTEPYY